MGNKKSKQTAQKQVKREENEEKTNKTVNFESQKENESYSFAKWTIYYIYRRMD